MPTRVTDATRANGVAVDIPEEAFRALAENANDGFLVATEDGIHVYANPRAAEITGYSVQELIGSHIRDLAHPDELATIARRFSARLSGKALSPHHETRIVRKDGQEVPIEFTGAKTVWKGRNADIVIIRDITERKQAEAALAREKELLATILRSIEDGVIATDPQGTLMMLNPAAEQLTGWSDAEARGRPLADVFRILDSVTREPRPDPVRQELGHRVPAGQSRHAILVSRDNTERRVAARVTPLREATDRVIGAVLTFQDVTERERLEAELDRVRRIESLGVLAGGIAHDFNNILTAVLGYVALARLEIPGMHQASEWLDEAEKAVARARDLTNQLLTFSRGGAPVRKAARLPDIIRDSVGFASRGTSLRVEFRIPEDLWPAEVDEGQVSQVLGNLVINASEAMPGGGLVEISAQNHEPDEMLALPVAPGRYVSISVTDHGEGIPPDRLHRVFEPFFSTKSRGSGLGLATCHSIVRRHDGHISVESVPGKGSTFRVFLPATAKEPESTRQAERIARGKGCVLVMDDEEPVRTVAERMLTYLGYEAELATDVDDVVARYKNALEQGRRFDAVILDLTIRGGAGGEEAIRRLREVDPGVRGIVASGYSNDAVLAHFRDYGFVGAIRKPFDPRELGRVLKV